MDALLPYQDQSDTPHLPESGITHLGGRPPVNGFLLSDLVEELDAIAVSDSARLERLGGGSAGFAACGVDLDHADLKSFDRGDGAGCGGGTDNAGEAVAAVVGQLQRFVPVVEGRDG